MEHIQWNCPAPIGIAQLDEQHWELHRLLWRLLQTLDTDPDGAVPEFQFIQLAKQTFDHFKSEERSFITLGYPGFVSHQIDHQRILERFRENLNRWNGPGAPPLVDLVEEFGRTTQRHLDTEDNAFAMWLEEKECPGAYRQDH